MVPQIKFRIHLRIKLLEAGVHQAHELKSRIRGYGNNPDRLPKADTLSANGVSTPDFNGGQVAQVTA